MIQCIIEAYNHILRSSAEERRMVRTAENLHRNAPIYESDITRDGESRFSRRALIFAAGAAAVGTVAGGKIFLGGNGSGERPAASAGSEGEPKDPNDRSVSAVQAVANIEALTLPDYYENRPWADPHQLHHRTEDGEFISRFSHDELREVASPPSVSEADSPEMLTEHIQQITELIANAARTNDDFIEARELGYPVGEEDKYGNELGNYPEYVKTEYTDHMVNGLFAETEGGATNEGLSSYLAGWAKEYEYTINDPRWHDFATVLIDMELLDDQKSNIPGETETTLTIGLNVGHPVAEGEWQNAANAHSGTMVVVAEEISGQYSLRLKSLDTQPNT